MLLTKSTTFIIGPIAELIGIIMNVIFDILAKIGIPNLGISIIIMTILIYMLMLPLTIRQQKFSKLQRKMQPELQKIQKKYQGRKDSASVAAQQEEMKQVYDKYGVSATGSCVQLLIQMPILFALYRVFYNIFPVSKLHVSRSWTSFTSWIPSARSFCLRMQMKSMFSQGYPLLQKHCQTVLKAQMWMQSRIL